MPSPRSNFIFCGGRVCICVVTHSTLSVRASAKPPPFAQPGIAFLSLTASGLAALAQDRLSLTLLAKTGGQDSVVPERDTQPLEVATGKQRRTVVQ
jgi:hypothetical protein